MPNVTKRMFTHSTEYIVWFTKGKNWIYNYEEMKKYNSGKQLRDVWEFPVLQGKERIKNEEGKPAHPTQKPLKLFTRLVEAGTNEGDLILDPFIGTGTVAEVAIQNKRKFIGIEQDAEYVKIAKTRIENIAV
jgi:site-specific DNA-methyltransferase (adenine-specific)/modification methylase